MKQWCKYCSPSLLEQKSMTEDDRIALRAYLDRELARTDHPPVVMAFLAGLAAATEKAARPKENREAVELREACAGLSRDSR